MMRERRFHRVVIVAVVVAIALSTFAVAATAHETESDSGYEFVFGGDDEPMITGERMWLEVEITDEETGDVVEDAEDLTVTVHRDDIDETYEAELEARYGEEGWYEAPVIFTEPGEYAFVIEGTVEGEEIRVQFSGDHFEVTDHTELHFPADGGDGDDGTAAEGNVDGNDDDGAGDTDGDGPGFGGGVAALAIGLVGTYLMARRQDQV